jgi:tRNA-specific 2-thiouridylase
MSKRVVVCLSGGVDSTVAAHLLVQQGYDVAGITFWFWSFPGAPDYGGKTKCCSLDTAALAAREVGIPHEEIDASAAFHRLVLEDFVARYRDGETPNPCGRCNRLLRFGLALDYAARNGFDFVATGHHVRCLRDPDGTHSLHRGADPSKDQTYFLYGLTQDHLERLLFPVGEMSKADVYAIARERQLTCAELPESQDLCFAVAGRTSFLFSQADLRPGPILDPVGRRLGTHEGLPHYTVGQRRGLGVPSDRPLYVLDIDPKRNALVVGEEDLLFRKELRAVDANFLSGSPPEDLTRLDVKIRYRSPAVVATFRRGSGERFGLAFDEPQRAITPGQLAVLYDGPRLLGGGTIARSERES